METLKLKGTYKFEIKDKEGNILDAWSVNNLVVNAGKAQLALLAGASGTPFTYLALGTSNTAVAGSQTSLQAEISTSGLARAAATVSRITTTVTNDTLSLVYIWTASGSQTIEEIGVFNAVSGGTMLSRALTNTRAMTSGQSIQATYTLQFI